MARILLFVSSERWLSLTWSRYVAISISMLSAMFSYFSILENNFANLASSFSCSSPRTITNMRCMRSANDSISFCASSTDSSGVSISPEGMKRRRKSSSSSSFLDLMHRHTIFSICGMNQISMNVLERLKHVWNAASTTLSFAALARKAACPAPSVVIVTS